MSARYNHQNNGESQCDRHHQDLYFGDDNRPGITTRILMMEKTMESFKYYFRAIVVLLIGLAAHALWDMITAKH